jgi:hypothetical protein
VQRGLAVLVGGLRIGALVQQKLGGLASSPFRCRVQRGPAALVPGLEIGALLKQHHHQAEIQAPVPAGEYRVQDRFPLGIVCADVRSLLQEFFDSFSLTVPGGVDR